VVCASLGQERVPASASQSNAGSSHFRLLLVCTSQCVGQGEFWFYFKTAPEDVHTGPEDADEVCREISLEIELLGFQPLIRFA
jgi:hypothetical protein